MKFLLFNIAVAAALVFLFTADRGEVQKIAGQVHDAAGDMKSYASKALGAGQRMIGREPATSGHRTEPAPPPAAKPAVADPGLTAPKPVVEPPPPPVRPQLPRQLAEHLPAAPETSPETRLKTGPAAAAKLDPEIARRRREVLNGIDTANLAGVPAAAPALKEGTQLMTPSDRRRELLSLAEEMELLYARSLGQ
jgi:hypothetical protein